MSVAITEIYRENNIEVSKSIGWWQFRGREDQIGKQPKRATIKFSLHTVFFKRKWVEKLLKVSAKEILPQRPPELFYVYFLFSKESKHGSGIIAPLPQYNKVSIQ